MSYPIIDCSPRKCQDVDVHNSYVQAEMLIHTVPSPDFSTWIPSLWLLRVPAQQCCHTATPTVAGRDHSYQPDKSVPQEQNSNSLPMMGGRSQLAGHSHWRATHSHGTRWENCACTRQIPTSQFSLPKVQLCLNTLSGMFLIHHNDFICLLNPI